MLHRCAYYINLLYCKIIGLSPRQFENRAPRKPVAPQKIYMDWFIGKDEIISEKFDSLAERKRTDITVSVLYQ